MFSLGVAQGMRQVNGMQRDATDYGAFGVHVVALHDIQKCTQPDLVVYHAGAFHIILLWVFPAQQDVLMGVSHPHAIIVGFMYTYTHIQLHYNIIIVQVLPKPIVYICMSCPN